MREFLLQNKKTVKIVACVLVVLLIGGTTLYQVVASQFPGQGQFGEMPWGENSGAEGQDAASVEGNRLTAEGTTSVLTVEQTIEFEAGRNIITVEEVYVSAGDTVAEGDALLKLTEDSMTALKSYYEQEIKEATEAVNEAMINQETGLLEAEYTLQQTQADASGAEATYNAAISELELSVEEKLQEYEDTKEKIAAYAEAIAYDYFYDSEGMTEKETRLATCTAEVETANTALATAQTTYDEKAVALQTAINALQEEANAGSTAVDISKTNALLIAYSEEQIAKADLEAVQQTVQSASSSLEQVQKEIEEANREYQSKITNAENQIEILSAQLDSLESNYEKAAREAETKKVELYNQYETDLLNGEYAQSTYNTTTTELNNALTSAQSKLEELQEQYDVLAAMTDGVVCANQAGTLASVSYEAGDILWGSSAIVSYYDMSKVYISIEVDQEQITKLAVGDSATVSLSGKRNTVTAEIASIASEKTSDGSISNVTYAVQLVLDNADGSISAGTSANITMELAE